MRRPGIVARPVLGVRGRVPVSGLDVRQRLVTLPRKRNGRARLLIA
jgi:hypothetical protein